MRHRDAYVNSMFREIDVLVMSITQAEQITCARVCVRVCMRVHVHVCVCVCVCVVL